MDKRLTSFLVKLASDLRELADYEKDPRAYLERSGLPREATEIILGGDRNRLSDLVCAEHGAPAGALMTKRCLKKPPEKRKPSKKKGPRRRGKRPHGAQR